MRKLKTKGVDALPDELGFRTYYRDWVKLTPEEVQKLTFDEVAQATAPRTPEEWKWYYEDQQAEREMEERWLEWHPDF